MFSVRYLCALTLVSSLAVSEAWPSSLKVLERELALQACGEVKPAERQDCGFTETAEECYSRGCCWQPTRSNGPWCYQPLRCQLDGCVDVLFTQKGACRGQNEANVWYILTKWISSLNGSHLDGCVDIPCTQKRACRGQSEVNTWQQCVQSGCCWVPTSQLGIPWCFERPDKTTRAPPTTRRTTTLTTTQAAPTTSTPQPLPRDCQDIYSKGHTKSGIYTISLEDGTQIEVYCEQELDSGGWTVLQKRQDGSVDFYRDWADYKRGFGSLKTEFWLGNDVIHLLTAKYDQKLKVELVSPDDEIAYADYETFWIGNETENYMVNISGYSGADPPGDSFLVGSQTTALFSTKDKDNDNNLGSCAQGWHGAWWYTSCANANLNGLYGSSSNTGLFWNSWKGYRVSMKATRLMIKKKV